ncbi:YlbF family regulator [Tepidibacillus infernus]|uniref:Uncharacterized protein n=1 Tax=Tepidibacillus decaturensis TaxID=1413211 RepID=A0A135L3D8_9BACI|nr:MULTISPECIES: YlbF family regulator [Tepidibacillus]KXG43470.1 hypothetical protein U473_05170 [Tepidibacillus decaturensis]GBF11335.1 hypothetical protein HK1_01359 [Tepidibacillus sp. HK-1]
MSQMDREQILEKVKELANSICEQEEIQIYQKAERQIKHHRRIQELIVLIKKKQQELVNAKHLKKTNYIKQLENELDLLNNELHSIPLVSQYQQNQREINRYLQSIIKLLKEQISDQLLFDEDDLPNPELDQVFQLKL